MGKINVLSFEVANLIAAGEVVDRPASVLKELLENAIDSGADNITAEIKNGGITFIRVSDNGCGMSAEDMPVSIRRHATSKINGAEDLDRIMTLGFRGEALAAISAVSRIRIISKTRDAACGTVLEAVAGEVVRIAQTGCPDGTTVIVEDLFANVPARRKFLKKDSAESMAVAANVEKVALSRPDIAIKLIVDGSIKFSTSGDGILQNTIYALLGRDFAKRLIEIKSDSDGIKTSGYIGRSDNVKANRNFQNFFINGRYVKSRTAMAAIEQAYSSYIAPEKFPACVIFIEINPSAVDVNVHPAKLEVKFSNEKIVFESIYYAVRSALEANDKKPDLPLKSAAESGTYGNRSAGLQQRGIPAANAFLPIEERGERRREQMTLGFRSSVPGDVVRMDRNVSAYNNIQPRISDYPPKRDLSQGQSAPQPSHVHEQYKRTGFPQSELRLEQENRAVGGSVEKHHQNEIPEPKAEADEQTQQSEVSPDYPASQKREPDSYRIIGEAFNCYVFVQTGEKLLVIDKHAAHERIIFERLKSNMKNADNAPQMLLIPIDVQLSPEELSAVCEYEDEISSTGFGYNTDMQTKTVHITRLPGTIPAKDAPDIFSTIADRLSRGEGNAAVTRDTIYEQALYQASCKAAIKAGHIDAPEHIKWLCDTLMAMPDITVCPHGRPVMTEITKRYIDRQFSRE